MHTGPANANGHRRRQIRARVLAEETHCALCGRLVDKSLTNMPGQHGPRCADRECAGCVPHPQRAEVDEDLPRARGGSALDRDNTRLMHRACNGAKGKLTIAEAHARAQGRRIDDRPASPPTNLVAW